MVESCLNYSKYITEYNGCPSESVYQMYRTPLLNGEVTHFKKVLDVIIDVKQSLTVRRNVCLLFDLAPNNLEWVCAIDFKAECFAFEDVDQNLHTTTA